MFIPRCKKLKALGKGLARRLPYKGPMDEVGRLAATFNAMLARLQSAYLRLQKAYAAQPRFCG